MFEKDDTIEKEIGLEVQNFYVDFVTKGLAQIYPGAQEEKLRRAALATYSVLSIPEDADVDNLTEDQQKMADENSAAFDDLEASLGLADLSEEESDRLCDLVDDLMREAAEEVQRHCLTKASELMFGPSDPGSVVVDMGFGGPMFEKMHR
jgi:hypothetical protein